jgi:hypothetical protein
MGEIRDGFMLAKETSIQKMPTASEWTKLSSAGVNLDRLCRVKRVCLENRYLCAAIYCKLKIHFHTSRNIKFEESCPRKLWIFFFLVRSGRSDRKRAKIIGIEIYV